MQNLIHINLPFFGRIFLQLDRITIPRVSAEQLTTPCGKELLLCLGSLRLYLTPASVVAAERR